jgi:ribosome biogenesis GTPase A
LYGQKNSSKKTFTLRRLERRGKNMVKEDNAFVTSLTFKTHPLINVNDAIRAQYFCALTYYVTHMEEKKSELITLRLNQYREFLLRGNASFSSDSEKSLCSIVDCRLQPWRRKYRYMLLCDVALITQRESAVRTAAAQMKERLPLRQHAMLDRAVEALHSDESYDVGSLSCVEPLIRQYKTNQAFTGKPERRIIVTANMSAGKSTLINALVGKQIARTSMEACTGNVCYIYNKPFEDGHIHLRTCYTELEATKKSLFQVDWRTAPRMATYFRSPRASDVRLCIIDTPGVNSAIHKEHDGLTKKALIRENYNTLVYVIKGTDLGTDAELRYLKWISDNIPHEKIVFVLNRLDEFRTAEDDIDASLTEVRADLDRLGFENPIICPFSAYFAYLIQLVESGEPLSEDERDEYEYLVKKFQKPAYDLSKYYTEERSKEDGTAEKDMHARSGLSGLEKIIFVRR